MRAFVTGGTGFIGGHVVRKLRARGDDVVALVRTPSKAGPLTALGCTIVEGDLLAPGALRAGMAGCDSVFHIAADYRVGVTDADREAMYRANVTGTETVLDAAIEAGAERIVYVSTIGYFGNTRGKVVDETFERTDLDWLSAYDETKYLAHEIAKDRIAKGAPVVIAQPGGVYGPGDTSDLALMLDRVRTGKVPFLPMGDTGFNFLHVDDASDGIILVHDKGNLGESYVLGGELTTVRGIVDEVCRIEGRKPPRGMPTGIVKAMAPFGSLIGKAMGTGPNLREIIKAGDGVTYWATDRKARSQLGYDPRDLATGLRETFRGE